MSGIKKNFFYSSILTTANYIFPLLTFPYVSRILGVTNVGICNFVDSIIHYFILFSMMGIGVIGIREVAKYRNDRQKLDETFSSLFWLNTIMTTIALVILILATCLADKLMTHWQMMVIGSLKLIMNYMLIEWLYKGLEEFRFITVRTIIVKTLYIIGVFLLVRQADDYHIYYLLTVMMIVINAFINIIYSRHHVTLLFRNVDVTLYVKPFFILGIYSLLTSMYLSFNVMYLGFVSGETEVGYYSTASKLYRILIAMFTAFTGVMLPRMSYLLSEGKVDEFKRFLSKSTNILFAFSIPLVFFTIIFAPTIINIIAGKGYEGAVLPMRIMMPLMLVIGYEQILIIQTLMPLKKDKAILRNSIYGASVAIFLNILLVPMLASVGSSIVWLASELAVLCSGQYYVSKYIGIHFPWGNLIRNIVINIPLMIILYFVKSLTGRFLPIAIASVVVSVYFIAVQIIICPNTEIRNIILQGYHRLVK